MTTFGSLVLCEIAPTLTYPILAKYINALTDGIRGRFLRQLFFSSELFKIGFLPEFYLAIIYTSQDNYFSTFIIAF